jgi:hypothetical protein
MAGENKSVNGGAVWSVGSSWVGTHSVESFTMSAKRANDVAGSRRWQYYSCLQGRGAEGAVVDTRRQGHGEECLCALGSCLGIIDEGSASSSWLTVCNGIRHQVCDWRARDGTCGWPVAYTGIDRMI